MFRNGMELVTERQVNFVLNHGALGDIITSLPALVHARLSHNAVMNMRVWAPQWQGALLKHLLAPYGEFEILDFANFPLKAAERKDWDGGPVALNSPPFNTHTRNRVHMVDFAFNYLLDARPENMDQRSYPVLAPLGPNLLNSKYVVFPVGATSQNKLFRASVMQPVIEWVHARGLTPVLVGTKVSHTQAIGNGAPEPIVIIDEIDKLPLSVLAMCLDLREKTSLLGLRDVLGYAEAVVGVDGGTLHLAGTTNTNIIYAMGTTLPKHRYIARYGDPNYKIRYVAPRDLECTGCQSNWTLLFGQDFRFCAHGDNKCMTQMHPDDFINGLKELRL